MIAEAWVLERIDHHRRHCPDAPAIEALSGATLSYGELGRQVAALALSVQREGGLVAGDKVGLVASNRPAWVIADLAAQLLGLVEVPLPSSFTSDHATTPLAGARRLFVDEVCRARVEQWRATNPALAEIEISDINELVAPAAAATSDSAVDELWRTRLAARREQRDEVIKIIHTSGSTSSPKGVRTTTRAIDIQVHAIARLLEPRHTERYLSLVPFSLLIEQICAVYVTLSRAGCLVLLPPYEPVFGEASFEAERYMSYLRESGLSFTTVAPALVECLYDRTRRLPEQSSAEAVSEALFGRPRPPLLACGGAAIDPAVLAELDRRGIRVHEGYGISENCSVVCWNHPGAYCAGTVGRPLPHIETEIAADGELLVRSPTLFVGYEGEDSTSLEIDGDGWLHTGDLVEERGGFLTIVGRKKNVIILNNTKNVAPEWVESHYLKSALLSRVVVFGDTLDHLVALVVPRDRPTPVEQISEALTELQDPLPFYARIREFTTPAEETLGDMFTMTGRPRRDAIWCFLSQRIAAGQMVEVA